MGQRAYIGPIAVFMLAVLAPLFGGDAALSVVLGAVAVTWFGSVEVMLRRAAATERERAEYRAAREREATTGHLSQPDGESEEAITVDAKSLWRRWREEEAARAASERVACTEHLTCGPEYCVRSSGHGHGPNPATGLWCWHLDEWWLGRPDDIADEGSDLAARRAQQAVVNGGDPFAHKLYPEPKPRRTSSGRSTGG